MDDAIAQKQRELQEIESKITQVTGMDPTQRRSRRNRQRRTSDRDAKRPSMRDEEDVEDDDAAFSAGRLRSTLATKRSKDERRTSVSNRSAPQEEPPAPRPKRPAAAEGDGNTKARHRRMFGMLMGTLEHANQRADKTTTQKKFEEIDQRLREQTEKEREESKQERIQLFNERRAKQAELLSLEQEAELPHLTQVWQSHYDTLKCAIRTKASPPIFFLPAKHNDATRELLKESAKDIDQLVSFRKGDYWKVLLPARLRPGEDAEHEDGEAQAQQGEENGKNAMDARSEHDEEGDTRHGE